ncbi:hypothetical protein P5F04_01785 [Clostridium perfringens]|uniref:Uncharacterized protein n=1 Tax=Clostridium perfringens TaxID=1502 RepID=A0A133N8U5_CLOPF|nr:hypothetical protein [Clostridium perfringens]DAP32340.1 MAG TPA: hypothetical protein [Caudoviricetes sp.]EHK2440348.1 hypothetical protein [Clostridium perfringens]KXA12721.1 hypothetical protein HMPREF3222_01244 [Clostridium perfringens]MBS5920361.1 hypothetical protein [Clostridium perfringens]MDK0625621.1 hypothetical protein [Clostridium perfringens]
MKKVVKLQKEVTNDLGDKKKLDLLIAIDNVKLIQYTCPSNEFYSVSHKDLIIYKEDNSLKISEKPINKDIIAVLTWFKYRDTQVIKLFIKDSSVDNEELYNITLRKVFKETNFSNFGEKLIKSLI